MIPRHVGGIAGGLLRGKWSAFARSTKTQRARTLPGENVAGLVADGDDRIVEGRLNMHHAKRHVLAFLLLEGFLFAFFLRRRCSAARCCCWFRHESSLVVRRWSFATPYSLQHRFWPT